MTTAPAHSGGISRSEWIQFIGISAVALLGIAFNVLGLSPVLIFLTAGVAVSGMAHILGIATEQAGDAAGPRLSALLNATFGNAAEIIIVVLAIREGGELIDVARFSIIGSVMGNVLLILGASLLVAGLRHGRQKFDATVAGVNGTMLMLATAALVIPTLFATVGGTNHSDEVGISHGVAVVMAVLYAAYLYASFQSPEDTGTMEGEAARWSTRLSLIMLAFSAIATGILSEVLVGAIEPTIEETGVSTVFIGLIVVPLIGNVAEHFAAVKIAWSGKLDFSMGIAFNSALQVALAVSAIAVLSGVIFGHEVVLNFGVLEVTILIAGSLLAALIAANGTSNWLEGAELLAIYVIAAIVFWYL